MSDSATPEHNGEKAASNLVPYDDWLKSIGLHRSTAYRYRRAGVISTINVFGRLYLTRDEIGRFEARALAGEFARKSNIEIARETATTSA